MGVTYSILLKVGLLKKSGVSDIHFLLVIEAITHV